MYISGLFSLVDKNRGFSKGMIILFYNKKSSLRVSSQTT
ncbi:hypothetical protein BN1423_930023 [Carnobacterium maltaromaticum]|nr:hypothetical protein CM318V1_220163 [Carnobacterium maltaromaticum]CRH23606.1 hypothetical protein BN1423_930023 [Carnobacterium maltaromaticum]